MPADRKRQKALDILHEEFIKSDKVEPLEFLREKGVEIDKRLRKYVKIWRQNKNRIRSARKNIST